MTTQDTEDVIALQRLLEKAEKDLEEARTKETYWANKLLTNLKSVEYLRFLLEAHGKHTTGEAQRPEQSVNKRFEGTTVRDATYQILKEFSHPLHVKEICEKLNAGGKSVDIHTVSTILAQQAKKGVFEKIRKGVFGLPNGRQLVM